MKTSVFFVFLYLLCHLEAAKKTKQNLVQEISDHKEFKKLMKTKTNVLVYFFDKPTSSKLINILREVADKVKGTGTIINVDCSQGDGKKLCKKLKIKLNDSGYILKHYKDGDFNKDYDRLETTESMTTFMKDPKGKFGFWVISHNLRCILYIISQLTILISSIMMSFNSDNSVLYILID